MLVTDAEVEECDVAIPKNLIVMKSSLTLMKKNIQEHFDDLEIVLSTPYKLCDYKPLFGMIFDEELKGYDYWGHCDMDVIFGDLHSYIEDKLYLYDRIFNRGHLCLYRNIYFMNHLFEKTDDSKNEAISFRRAFTVEYPCFFDEMKGMNLVSNQCKWYQDVDYEKYIIDVFPGDLEFHDWCNMRTYMVKYQDKKIYKIYLDSKGAKAEEYMYVHFQKRKMRMECKVCNMFYIKPNVFSNNDSYSISKWQSYIYKWLFLKSRVERAIQRIKKFGLLTFIKYKIDR
jgi:hypothetical protein